MVMDFRADIQNMMNDCGTAITFGATTVYAIVDWPEGYILQSGGNGGVKGAEISVTYKTGAIAPVKGSSIVIGGATYTVQAPPLVLDDGGNTQMVIKR